MKCLVCVYVFVAWLMRGDFYGADDAPEFRRVLAGGLEVVGFDVHEDVHEFLDELVSVFLVE